MTTDAIELWPIFICYRRVDGAAAAQRLYEMLNQWQTTGPDGTAVHLDVYLDIATPGVGDWQSWHRPYLEKARALIVICTPGAKIDEGPKDWVHRELDWWLAHRETAPIVIDPLNEGARYVPTGILQRWPDIQRITVIEDDWKRLASEEREEKTNAVRRQVIGAILPSGAAVYAEELETERRRGRRLRNALAVVGLLMIVAFLAGLYAYDRKRDAEASRDEARYSKRVTDATALDARAANAFAQARLIDARVRVQMDRWRELRAAIASFDAKAQTAGTESDDEWDFGAEASVTSDASEKPAAEEKPAGEEESPATTVHRLENLRYEIAQVERDLGSLRSSAARLRSQGRDMLARANTQWPTLKTEDRRSRRAPEAPLILSVELINAGQGESILLHYGTPDDLHLVMINSGPRAAYRTFVEPRLRELRDLRGAPVAIEVFVVGDQDADKVYGLWTMLEDLRNAAGPGEQLVEIRRLWANFFMDTGGSDVREKIVEAIRVLGLRLNPPFDHLVMTPPQGRAEVAFAGGLEVVVLGPGEQELRKLYDFWDRRAKRKQATIEAFPVERFSRIAIRRDAAPLVEPAQPNARADDCRPSENARATAKGAYLDMSVSNLASTVLLFRFREKTFLYTGDTRGDRLLASLERAGLMDRNGHAHVDLLSIPHGGSDRNVTIDFFRRVQADGYLFSGDGKFGNPEATTVASLIAARGCDEYRMFFTNRDGSDKTFGAGLDEFFSKELPYSPNYRRVFRAAERGSVMIDLMEPMPY